MSPPLPRHRLNSLVAWMNRHPLTLNQLNKLRTADLPWPPPSTIRYALDLYTLDPRLWPAPWRPELDLGWPPNLLYLWGMMVVRYRVHVLEGWEEAKRLFELLGVYLGCLGLAWS